MTGGFSTAWLGLREPADAAARSRELAGALALPGDVEVHDLGCGTGSMARWLAPRLPGRQRWVLHDRDPALLAYAAAAMPAGVAVATRLGDVTGLTAADLAGASLVTCSALLDLLTAAQVDALAAACAGVGCPALFTLTVVGDVVFHPADPLDGAVAAAFDAHQRRGGLLGPDASEAAATAFARRGAAVTVRPSPWRLGPPMSALTAEWLRGWVGAAREQRPDLRVDGYLRRRLDEAAAGRLSVIVGHRDLLARFG
jgi:SAM-dependent methyltransferase